jgi:hypothetical protein
MSLQSAGAGCYDAHPGPWGSMRRDHSFESGRCALDSATNPVCRPLRKATLPRTADDHGNSGLLPSLRHRRPVRLVTCNGETVEFGDDNSLRCLRPGSGASRTGLFVPEPRRKRRSASTNNGVVFAAGSHRRIKRSVVAVQTIMASALPVVDHRQYGAERLTRLSERHRCRE